MLKPISFMEGPPVRGEFLDFYGVPCSVQQSSIAGTDCIWLGRDQDQKGRETPGMRMHLDRERAAELIPILQRFVETGDLSNE